MHGQRERRRASAKENRYRSTSRGAAQLAGKAGNRHRALGVTRATVQRDRSMAGRRRRRIRLGHRSARGSVEPERTLPYAGVKTVVKTRGGRIMACGACPTTTSTPSVAATPAARRATSSCRRSSAGSAEIAFTDHIPLYFLRRTARDPKLAMREDQFDGYVAEVEELRREFAGCDRGPPRPRGRLRRGPRGGARPLARARGLGPRPRLGPLGRRAAGSTTGRARPRASPRGGRGALYDEYYRLLAKAAGTGFFDVLTHFDLPKKHGHRPAAPRRGRRGARPSPRPRGRTSPSRSPPPGCASRSREAYPEPRLLAGDRRGRDARHVLLRRPRAGGSGMGLREDARAGARGAA